MAQRQPRIAYRVPTLNCNLTKFLPDGKQEADHFIAAVCSELIKKSRIKEATPTENGIVILFYGSGLEPMEVARLLRSIDEVVDSFHGTR